MAVWFNGAREEKREGGRAGELRIGLPEEQMVTNREEDRQKRREEGEEEEAAAHIFALKASFLDALGGEAGVHLDFASVLKTGL